MIGTMIALAILSQFTVGYLDGYDVSLHYGMLWGTDTSLEGFAEYFDLSDWDGDKTKLDHWQRGGVAFVHDSMQGRDLFIR